MSGSKVERPKSSRYILRATKANAACAYVRHTPETWRAAGDGGVWEAVNELMPEGYVWLVYEGAYTDSGRRFRRSFRTKRNAVRFIRRAAKGVTARESAVEVAAEAAANLG